jgi:hypothetical protein
VTAIQTLARFAFHATVFVREALSRGEKGRRNQSEDDFHIEIIFLLLGAPSSRQVG